VTRRNTLVFFIAVREPKCMDIHVLCQSEPTMAAYTMDDPARNYRDSAKTPMRIVIHAEVIYLRG
jgi:hypothetical protein